MGWLVFLNQAGRVTSSGARPPGCIGESRPSQSRGRLPLTASFFAICLLSPAAAQPASTIAGQGSQADSRVQLTYIGNAGWEISDGKTIILVDPYVSQFSYYRREGRQVPPASSGTQRPATPTAPSDEILTPDTGAIDQRISKADYILITHGHEDHMLDAPYISRRTGAAIIGHETAANIARAYDVPDASLITVRGGEDYEFGSFSIKVIPSIHTALFRKRYNNLAAAGMAPRGLRAPLRRADFVEGGSLAYLLRIGGQQILIMGSMNYIEREMEGLRPTVALVGANPFRQEIHDYTGRLLRALGNPPLVIATHADGYGAPGSEAGVAENLKAFRAEVHKVAPKTKVVAPEWFKPLVVPSP